MNQKKKVVIFGGFSIVLIVVVALVGIWIRQTKTSDEMDWSYSDGLYEYFDYAMYTDTSDYDKSKIEAYHEACHGELDYLESEEPLLYHSMKGLKFDSDGAHEEAMQEYQYCLEQKDSYHDKRLMNTVIWARCYYEMVADAISHQEDDKAKEYMAEMKSYLMTEEDYIDLIYLNTLLDTRIYQMENGAEYATEIAAENIAIAEAYGYPSMGYVYQCAADAFSYAGNQTMFIQYMTKALEFYESDEEIVFCEISIGTAYMVEEDYKKAIDYLLEAFSTDLEESSVFNYEMKVYSSCNLAIAYIQLKEYAEAEKYLVECKKWIDQIEDAEFKKPDMASYLLTKAEYDMNTGEMDLAIQELDQSMEIFLQYDSFPYSNFDVMLYADYADVYYKMGEYDKALEYYGKCEKMIEYRGSGEKQVYLEGFFDTYKAMKDYEKAIQYAEKLQVFLHEKVLNNTPVQKAMFEYENQKQEDLIDRLRLRENQMLTVIILFILLLGVGCHLLFVVINRNREIKKLNEELRKISERDGLTELYNRRKLDEYLSANWEELLTCERPVSVAMVDVDFFKLYNDHYGHQQGDHTLAEITKIMKNNKRDCDFIARYGGEEFMLILPLTGEQEARDLLKKMQRDLDELQIPHIYSAVADHVTISIGCVTIDESAEIDQFEEAIQKADLALYEAKKERNSIVAMK